MSEKDDELTRVEGLEFELSELAESSEGEAPAAPADQGLDLSLEDIPELDLSSGDEPPATDSTSLTFGDLDLSSTQTNTQSLSDDVPEMTSAQIDPSFLETAPLEEDSFNLSEENEISEEVKEKLKEIDAIMDSGSQLGIQPPSEDPNVPLVSDDLNLDDLGFTAEDEEVQEVEEDQPTRVDIIPEAIKAQAESKKKQRKEKSYSSQEDLRDISGAYSGELERLQATISNLRSDREELLNRIQKMEDEKVIQNRQTLTIRAEMDERKIELSIIRRKLNDEIAELKDKMRIHEEKRLILEEKNRLLQQEVEKAGQKSKLDVKKVMMRERELEQKLELLKADAETQIRNRDLKILELKRKIDAMEFDMESLSTQEKRSVESRFELEDKLEKAIRTLRSAITVLEDETDQQTIEALKKSIDI